MRIIRFVADDGRVLCGEPRNDGTAAVVRDVGGVLGAVSAATRLAQLRGRHAVVADDDENMRRLVCTVLEKAGCRCTRCADGAEAMEALQAGGIDLVVSDIMMPHYNGYEIYAAAKELNEALPVLLITGFGYDPSHSLLRASKEGLQAVLYKPFTPQQLVEQLLRSLEPTDASPNGMLQRTGREATVSTILPPVRPSNILCIGRNWPAAGAEAGGDPDPVTLELFMKPTTSVQANGAAVELPEFGDVDPEVDAEGELAIVIGRTAENVPEDEALDRVLGYTIAADITARRWQTAEGAPLWMRGKGFDTFCPIGPVLVTTDDLPDPSDLTITTLVNDTVVRQGSTASMIRPVARIISELSRHVTLEPGTLILTGSPPRTDPSADLSFLRPGDEIAVEIEGIGRLVCPVAESS